MENGNQNRWTPNIRSDVITLMTLMHEVDIVKCLSINPSIMLEKLEKLQHDPNRLIIVFEDLFQCRLQQAQYNAFFSSISDCGSMVSVDETPAITDVEPARKGLMLVQELGFGSDDVRITCLHDLEKQCPNSRTQLLYYTNLYADHYSGLETSKFVIKAEIRAEVESADLKLEVTQRAKVLASCETFQTYETLKSDDDSTDPDVKTENYRLNKKLKLEKEWGIRVDDILQMHGIQVENLYLMNSMNFIKRIKTDNYKKFLAHYLRLKFPEAASYVLRRKSASRNHRLVSTYKYLQVVFKTPDITEMTWHEESILSKANGVQPAKKMKLSEEYESSMKNLPSFVEESFFNDLVLLMLEDENQVREVGRRGNPKNRNCDDDLNDYFSYLIRERFHDKTNTNLCGLHKGQTEANNESHESNQKMIKSNTIIADEYSKLNKCHCCFDEDFPLNEIIICSENHTFCITCVRGYWESLINRGEFKFRCLAPNCRSNFQDSLFQKVLNPEILANVQRKMQEGANISENVSTESKPKNFCFFPVVLLNADDNIFCCNNLACNRGCPSQDSKILGPKEPNWRGFACDSFSPCHGRIKVTNGFKTTISLHGVTVCNVCGEVIENGTHLVGDVCPLSIKIFNSHSS